MGPIVCAWPQWVCFIERPVVQNLFVDGTSGNKDETFDPGFTCGFNQTQCSEQISFSEFDQVAGVLAKCTSCAPECSMDYRVTTVDECHGRACIREIAWQPGYLMRERIQRLAITRWTVPAPQLVAVTRQILDNVVAEESSRTCYRDLHLSSCSNTSYASQPTGRNLSAYRGRQGQGRSCLYPAFWSSRYCPHRVSERVTTRPMLVIPECGFLSVTLALAAVASLKLISNSRGSFIFFGCNGFSQLLLQ